MEANTNLKRNTYTDIYKQEQYEHVRQAKGGTGARPGTHPTLETNKQTRTESFTRDTTNNFDIDFILSFRK